MEMGFHLGSFVSSAEEQKENDWEEKKTYVKILDDDSQAFLFLIKSDKNHIPALVETLTKASIEVCEGQAYDMDFEKRNDVKIEEYIKMITLKTGVLLGSALKLGAITANASQKDIDYLYDFGINIGIAFQLQENR